MLNKSYKIEIRQGMEWVKMSILFVKNVEVNF